jgi:4-amino-4-deoxy-L-arabinose transferase-like glycosyltransferase
VTFERVWSSPSRRRRIFVMAVFLAALVLRLLWIYRVHPVPESDFAWYRNQAIQIIHGQGYSLDGHPTAYFPIGFPLFLAGVYWLFGAHWLTGVLANVILSAATAGLLFLMAERLYGWRAGLVSGLLMACYLPHIEWSSVLCSEILFTFLFLLSTYLWVRVPAQERQWKWLVLSGIVLGLACLVRPIVLLLPGAYLLYALAARVGLWPSIQRTLVISLVMLATVSPMTIRNYVDFHRFIPVSTNGGVNLWQGNNPHANGEYFWPQNPSEDPFLNYVHNEVTDNQVASHMATQYILHHPRRTIRLGFTKWNHLFEGVDNAQFWSIGHSNPPVSKVTLRTVAQAALWNYRLVLAFAVLGLFTQAAYVWKRKDPRSILLWLVIAYYLGLFFIFPAWDRMRAPIEPWLVLLAGTFVASLWQRQRFYEDASKEASI